MKGPAIFLAQFASGTSPFDKLETMAQWAAGLGYVGVQVPTAAASGSRRGRLRRARTAVAADSRRVRRRRRRRLLRDPPRQRLARRRDVRTVPRRCRRHKRANILFDPSHFLLRQLDYAAFIRSHMIRTTAKAFDDFAASSTDPKVHARILGLDQ